MSTADQPDPTVDDPLAPTTMSLSTNFAGSTSTSDSASAAQLNHSQTLTKPTSFIESHQLSNYYLARGQTFRSQNQQRALDHEMRQPNWWHEPALDEWRADLRRNQRTGCSCSRCRGRSRRRDVEITVAEVTAELLRESARQAESRIERAERRSARMTRLWRIEGHPTHNRFSHDEAYRSLVGSGPMTGRFSIAAELYAASRS